MNKTWVCACTVVKNVDKHTHMPVCILTHTHRVWIIESFWYLFSWVCHHLGANVNKVASSSALASWLADRRWTSAIGRANLLPPRFYKPLFSPDTKRFLRIRTRAHKVARTRPLYFNLVLFWANCATGAMQDIAMNTTLAYKWFQFVDTHLRGMSLPHRSIIRVSLSDVIIISPFICIFFWSIEGSVSEARG